MATTTVINWNNRSSTAISAGWVSCAYGASLYVAVSYSSYKIMTSSDGSTWTISTFIPTLRIYKIIYNSGLFVAVGDLNTVNASQLILTSPDGLNWTYRTSPKAPLYTVTYGNGLFVATGKGNSLITSNDGIEWTLKTISVFSSVLKSPPYHVSNSIRLTNYSCTLLEFGNNIFFGMTSLENNYKIIISTDNGLSWIFYSEMSKGFGTPSSLFFNSLNNLFYYVSNDGTIGKTSDGINVVINKISNSINLLGYHWLQSSIAYGNNMFVIVGDNRDINSGCMISYDCENWDWTTMPGSTIYNFVGFLNNRFIALASGSTQPIYVVVGTTQTKLKTVLSNFNDVTRTYTTTPFVIPYPTSNRSGSFSYFITGNSYIGTSYRQPTNNTLYSVATGTTWVTAVQAETTDYALATKSCLLTVNKADPVISNFNNITKNVGDANFTLTKPITNSNGVFTYTSSNTSVATISGSTVSVIGLGIAIITASQSQGTHPEFSDRVIYNNLSITCSLTVSKATPLISSFNITEKIFGTAPFILTPLTSNSPGSISYTSSNPEVATISGSTVTINSAGTTNITATQSATTNYFEASTTSSLTVIRANPTLSGFNNLNKFLGDSSFFLTPPTSNSTGTFSYSCSNSAVATVSGSTVTIIGLGSVTITATQAGTANYLEASRTCSLTVIRANPTLSDFNYLTKIIGDSSFVLTPPTSNSTGTFTYSSSNPAVATVSGSTVTIIGLGSVTITATQAGSTDYEYGSASINCILTVIKRPPTLSGFNNLTKLFRDSFVLTPPISDSPGLFSYSTSDLSVATISGSNVNAVGTGYAIITATQAETSYYSSRNISCIINVTEKITTILSNFDNITKTYSILPFNLTEPITNSTGAFIYSSSNTAVATISGSTVTMVGTGSTTLTATQSATSTHTSATSTLTLTIIKITPILSDFTNLIKTFGDSSFSLSGVTSTSSGLISFTCSNTNIATITGTTVNIIGGGTANIIATQLETGNFTSLIQNVTLTVNKKEPVLSEFNSLTKTIGDSSFRLSPPVSMSNGTFSYSSSNTEVATISGNIVNMIAGGYTIITATQAATSDYASKTIDCNLMVNKKTTVLSVFNNITKKFGDANFILNKPLSNCTGAFLYSSSNTEVASISGSTVTMIGAGSTTITATQGETSTHTSATINLTLIVNKKKTVLSEFNDIDKTLNDELSFMLTEPTSNGNNGAFTYTSSDTSIASVEGNSVEIVSEGVTIIEATQEETINYTLAKIKCFLSIIDNTKLEP